MVALNPVARVGPTRQDAFDRRRVPVYKSDGVFGKDFPATISLADQEGALLTEEHQFLAGEPAERDSFWFSVISGDTINRDTFSVKGAFGVDSAEAEL